MVPIPRMATTVILLRERTRGFEALLLKRHEKSSFMAGNYVYPGGRVDREDCIPQIYCWCKGPSPGEAKQILGGPLSPEESLGHWIAGIRELFEEAGILLAYGAKGDLFQPKSQEERDRFSQYRRLLQKKQLTMPQLAQEEELTFALDQIHYCAHWITPEARSERFDTRFFLARHPAGQEASHDEKETTVGVWITPEKALQENLTGEVALSPPTLKTLEDFCRFKSVDDICNSLARNEIKPILPILTKVSGDPLILFPWDPEYPLFQRGESPRSLEHGVPSVPGSNSTRVLMKEGRWVPYCRDK